MVELIDRLRASRKNPSVLRMKVLQVKGERPDILIFIFEGQEDIAVYEEWIRRIGGGLEYEPIGATGKEQVLALCSQLIDSGDPLLDKLFFFVDRDFDSAFDGVEVVFELGAHSIESLLCTGEVLESLLKDEFRLNGKIELRNRIVERYSQVLDAFRQISAPIDFQIYVSSQRGLEVLKKPEKASEIAKIELCQVKPNYEMVSDLVELSAVLPATDIDELNATYMSLPCCLRCRGKYCVDFFRRWLRLAFEDAKSVQPTLFDSQMRDLKGDPSQSSLRRFASASHIPEGLTEFVRRIPNVA